MTKASNEGIHNVIDDPSTFTDTSSTALLAATTYRLATLTHDFTSIPAANRALSLIQRSVNADGWLTGTVDPLKFHEPSAKGEHSPEGQAFVLLLYAGWRAFKDLVASGRVDASGEGVRFTV